MYCISSSVLYIDTYVPNKHLCMYNKKRELYNRPDHVFIIKTTQIMNNL